MATMPMGTLTAEGEQLNIIAGPSREGLFDALRLAHEQRAALFQTRTRVETRGITSYRELDLGVHIDGLRREDGSGYRWLFVGTAYAGEHEWYKVEGYLDTKARRGFIKQYDQRPTHF